MVKTRDVLLLGLLVVGLRLLSVGDVGGGESGDDLGEARRRRSRVRLPRTPARPPRDRGGQLEATSGGREHASGAATAAARRGGGRGEAHSGRGRRADPEAGIVQVEVMEEDMQEAEVGEAVSLAGEELPEGSGLAAVEEAGEGSWEEGDTAGGGKWVGMLRPDMEFLVSKQSITATSSGCPPPSLPIRPRPIARLILAGCSKPRHHEFGTGSARRDMHELIRVPPVVSACRGGHKPMVTFAFKDHRVPPSPFLPPFTREIATPLPGRLHVAG